MRGARYESLACLLRASRAQGWSPRVYKSCAAEGDAEKGDGKEAGWGVFKKGAIILARERGKSNRETRGFCCPGLREKGGPKGGGSTQRHPPCRPLRGSPGLGLLLLSLAPGSPAPCAHTGHAHTHTAHTHTHAPHSPRGPWRGAGPGLLQGPGLRAGGPAPLCACAGRRRSGCGRYRWRRADAAARGDGVISRRRRKRRCGGGRGGAVARATRPGSHRGATCRAYGAFMARFKRGMKATWSLLERRSSMALCPYCRCAR